MPEEKASEAQSNSQLRGTVENKAPKPAGLLPKNTQQMVILGVAVVMVLIMWLTGGGKRTASSATVPPAGARVQPPNAATVEDFKQTIQQQQAATRQPISPSNLARLQAMGLAGDVPPGGSVLPPDGTIPQPGGIVGSSGAGTQSPPLPDPVKEDKKKREYLSLFAPNVAFTYRKSQEAEQLVGPRSGAINPPVEHAPQAAQATDLDAQVRQAEAQFAAAGQTAAREARGVTPAPGEQQRPSATETERVNPAASRPGVFNSFTGKRYVVFEGTVLETLLINRLNGSFSGPVNCLVTTDIYSHDRQQVLIPAGTKVLGEAKKVEAFGQQRLAVFFHRLIMPDGYSVSLDQFKGLNQIGETALRDKVNNHYLQIFGASLAVGILGGISQAGTGNVLTNSPLDRVRAGFGASLANSSTEILDRFLNILPTVTIREGNRVKVYLSGDFLLPDYAQHTMQPDL
ncbi:MAG TPA: TrbI/VirB10 family protein [Candidatus Dormibacteraeota bacterium]|nr:TrbI/VirB10 family protein [Candidatus Dormibacteraeota bacterium]